MAEERLEKVLTPIIVEKNAKKVIQKSIELPYSIDKKAYNFWRLQFILKWNNNYYRPEKMKPLVLRLTEAFQELGYKEAHLEADLLIHIIDSIAIKILQEGLERQLPYKNFLLKKYKLLKD